MLLLTTTCVQRFNIYTSKHWRSSRQVDPGLNDLERDYTCIITMTWVCMK